MRITETHLRRIIRQEVRALRESSPADGMSAADPYERGMLALVGDAIERANRGDSPRQVFTLAVGGLKKLGVDPYDGLPDVIGRMRGTQGLRRFAGQLEAMALDQGY